MTPVKFWPVRILLLLGFAFAASGALAQQAPPRATQPRPSPPARAPARKPAAAPPKVLSPVEQRIQAVENNLLPSIRLKGRPLRDMTIAARMKKHAVTGVSVAVINGYAIEWAKGYGAADTATRFPAGAAGEPVMAAVAMVMVQNKKLELDKDVNRSLRKWKIPRSDYTKAKAVTLGALLSHMSGVSRLASGATLDQVLAGVRVEQIPTLEYRPWGADYAVVEQLLADVAKKPFADVARETLLGPLGLSHSSFRPPLAAYGLWTTPFDLARFAVEIQLAVSGKQGKVLKTPTALSMITPAAYSPAGYGLIPGGRDSSLRFDHRGRTDGAETELVAFAYRGQGAVVMTAGGGAGGGRLIVEILNAIGQTYGWPNYVPADKVVAKVDPRVYDRFVGNYVSGEQAGVISKRGTRLFFGAGKDATELFPESVSDFFTAEGDAIYSFVFDENAKVSAMTVKRRDGDVRWDRR